jgi:hypothetical protein
MSLLEIPAQGDNEDGNAVRERSVDDEEIDVPPPEHDEQESLITTTTTWKGVSTSILDLFNEIHSDLNSNIIQMNTSPSYFITIFFSSKYPEIREKVLLEFLMMIYNDPIWWDLDKKKTEIGRKCEWACKHWGIENDLDIILGKGNHNANLNFWTRVVKTVKRLSKLPLQAKAMLSQFPSNEEDLSWEQVLANGVESAQNLTNCVTLTDVMNMEVLLNNKMENGEMFQNLINLVVESLRARNIENHIVEDSLCLAADSHERCLTLQKLGDAFCEYVGNYIKFMQENDNFNKEKTVFMVFHSEFALKFLNNATSLHREFMKELIELEEFEDYQFEDVVDL